MTKAKSKKKYTPQKKDDNKRSLDSVSPVDPVKQEISGEDFPKEEFIRKDHDKDHNNNQNYDFNLAMKKRLDKIMAYFSKKSDQKRKKSKKNKGKKDVKAILLKILNISFKVGLILLFLGIITCGGIYIYFAKDLPPVGHERDVAESTKIFDRTGQVLLYEIHGEENRTRIAFNEIADNMVKALVAAEDERFYSHIGVDPKSVIRAAVRDLQGKPIQGASTITMQYIKNAILTPERKLSRKIKEVILAIELERRTTKDKILELYLNQVPFGSNAYGIQAAAQTFFGKNAKDLTIDESALLAATLKGNTKYSPYGDNTDLLEARQQTIIKKMEDLGYITSDEAKQALAQNTLDKVIPLKTEIKAPHFVMYVRSILDEEFDDEYGQEIIEKGGLRIYTSLDYEMQEKAEQMVKQYIVEQGEDLKAQNAALVAMDPKSGDILTMVGSYDYFDKENNGNVNVAISKNQPGSSFKPFAYATSFAKGYLPETYLYDVETNFTTNDKMPDYIPLNYNKRTSGPVQMKQALATSLNIPAVKTLYLAGIDDTLETAKAMGITTLTDTDNYGLALVLGGGDVTLLEQTSAYGVFANDGIKHEKKAILRIEDSNGNVLKEAPDDSGKRVLASQVARQINDCLNDNDERAIVFGNNSALNIPGYKVAAKTGTTQDYRDAWTMGYTPELVTGVWVGNNYNEPMREGAGGITAAGPLWNQFMSEFVPEFSSTEFIEPIEEKINKPMVGGFLEKEEKVRIDEETGYLATEDCKKKYTDKVTLLKNRTILYYVDKDNPRGDYPEKPKEDPQYENWEKGLLKWAEKNDDYAYITDLSKRTCKGKEDDDDDDDDDDD